MSTQQYLFTPLSWGVNNSKERRGKEAIGLSDNTERARRRQRQSPVKVWEKWAQSEGAAKQDRGRIIRRTISKGDYITSGKIERDIVVVYFFQHLNPRIALAVPHAEAFPSHPLSTLLSSHYTRPSGMTLPCDLPSPASPLPTSKSRMFSPRNTHTHEAARETHVKTYK